MSVRLGMLALLTEGPAHGYHLRQEFENRTGGKWPLNIGQVYTTLSRLQRDELVAEGERQDDGSVSYQLTERGRREVELWWLSPVERAAPTRDELAIKLALAVTADGIKVGDVVQRQRRESLRALQEYTRIKARTDEPAGRTEFAAMLVLDSLIFGIEAELRWLDHVEASLVRMSLAAQRRQSTTPANQPSTPPSTPPSTSGSPS